MQTHCARSPIQKSSGSQARFTRTRDCPNCERTGLMPFSGGQSAVACPTCKGRGEVRR